MIMTALALALFATPPDRTALTFVHGDEQIVSWLDRDAVRRTGDRVRLRTLRIRHADQAFWVVQDIDCRANTWALVATKAVTATDDSPPSLEGDSQHQAITHDDRAQNALRRAVCDGVFVQASIAPARGGAAAIARLAETKAAAVRARPLELVVVRAGASPIFLDRATLEGGGPQWEVRSLKMTAGRGLWSGWTVDCDRSDLALDLQWTAPLRGSGYGVITQDRFYGGQAVSDLDEIMLVRTACDPGVWDRPIHGTIQAATAAARANPR